MFGTYQPCMVQTTHDKAPQNAQSCNTHMAKPHATRRNEGNTHNKGTKHDKG
jgi:hypothetical protein